jgi:hypothetical protein
MQASLEAAKKEIDAKNLLLSRSAQSDLKRFDTKDQQARLSAKSSR